MDAPDPQPKPKTDPPPAAAPDAPLAGMDAWMADSPWHARVIPFFVYIVLLTVLMFLPEAAAPLKPFIYTAQCGVVVWLLWRYRKLTPELTASFHWLAVPTGVGLLVAWVVLGYAMGGELGHRWATLTQGDWIGAFGPYPYDTLGQEPNRFGPALNAELQPEPHELQALFRGLAQFATDLPVIGEPLERSAWGKKLAAEPPALAGQLRDTPVGAITFFAIVASTIVFMLSHGMRDWPGCIACGVVWCWLVWWTNRPRKKLGETWASITAESGGRGRGRCGLGPVIWSHGITNALLWGYTVAFGDWRFL